MGWWKSIFIYYLLVGFVLLFFNELYDYENNKFFIDARSYMGAIFPSIIKSRSYIEFYAAFQLYHIVMPFIFVSSIPYVLFKKAEVSNVIIKRQHPILCCLGGHGLCTCIFY